MQHATGEEHRIETDESRPVWPNMLPLFILKLYLQKKLTARPKIVHIWEENDPILYSKFFREIGKHFNTS